MHTDGHRYSVRLPLSSRIILTILLSCRKPVLLHLVHSAMFLRPTIVRSLLQSSAGGGGRLVNQACGLAYVRCVPRTLFPWVAADFRSPTNDEVLAPN